MNETERLAYLEAMGVASYIPRLVLPGALPSPACSMPVYEVEMAVATTVTVDAGREVISGGDVLKQLLAGPAPKPASPQNVVSPPIQTTIPSSAQVGVRFHWTIFQPTPAMLLLVPAAHTDKDCMQLLTKILAAIGVAAPTVAMEQFIWPPATNTRSAHAPVVNSLADAKETLHGLLEGYQMKQKKLQNAVDHVLVFDENLGQTLFDGFSVPAMQVRILPSLQLMLNSAPEKVAALKQAAWQRLKDLKKS